MLSDLLERKLNQIKNPATVPFSEPKTGDGAPTEKQVSYFKALVGQKQLSDEQRNCLKSSLCVYDKGNITSIINWLVGLPWMPRPVVESKPTVQASAVSKIGAGRYAIQHPQGDLRFYEVRRPKEGKWAGFVFLSQLSGENHIPMRDKTEREIVYAQIAKDVMGSLKLYGQKIGRCGHCSKQLTDEVSREFGIGPVCRKALGI